MKWVFRAAKYALEQRYDGPNSEICMAGDIREAQFYAQKGEPDLVCGGMAQKWTKMDPF